MTPEERVQAIGVLRETGGSFNMDGEILKHICAAVDEEREAIVQIGQSLLMELNFGFRGPATDAHLLRRLEAAIRARSAGEGERGG